MVTVATDLWDVVASVVDPEIPVLTIEDLGVLRDVTEESGTVRVTITPTYSGCPAMRQIEDEITSALLRAGVEDFEIIVVHNPPWTTDWISAEGHRKLSAFGIAPPSSPHDILCPRCQAHDPRLVARFSGTACQALLVCSSCGEPFKQFKVLR
ncbi:MAG TPA: 1,2-phenylacetyl-CoA epoxidase subunit PaaD [Acidimicrobiia bacterium]|nr:1,2-phenylacetyl-CoA epoxidase subunit PaaD [Acidimicrobiia bacterium]